MPTTLVFLAIAAGSILALFVAAMIAVKTFYNVPRADEALVKTGGSSPVVSTGGGLWVIPLFHRVTRVSLKAVKIPIERVGENALPTANKIPAELRGELIVRVSPDDPKHVVLAAQALGADGHGDSNRMEHIIQQQVDSLVTDALRTAAFKKTFQELNSGKKEFADEVTQLLAEDLAKLGLTLTAVTIPHLKQGEFTKDAGDVFAAEGQRNVAETVAQNRQETNKINREAEIKVQEQNVEARKRALELDRQEKELEAEQARQVAEYVATKATETRKAELAQEQARQLFEAEQVKSVKTGQLQQDQLVQAARIEQEQTLATQRARAAAEQKKAEEEAARVKQEAEIARQRAVEAAGIEKDKAIRVADEARQQAIAEAEIAKQVAVAAKRAEEASARAAQAEAEALQQRSEQAIVTVRAEAEAEREKKVVLIKAQEEASKQQIAADRDVYVQTKKAEAERDAALKRAEAAKAEAQGRAEAVKAEATGQAEAARAEATGRAEALKLAAEAEATARTTRANAEFDASDKEARAKIALAAALLEEGKARAESERLLTEARNSISNAILARDVALAAITQAPAVVRELMAPITKVSDVKILQIQGLGGAEGDAANSLPATILGSGLAVSGALPLVKAAVQNLVQNEDVREVAGVLGGVAKTAIRDVASAIKDVPTDGGNGAGSA